MRTNINLSEYINKHIFNIIKTRHLNHINNIYKYKYLFEIQFISILKMVDLRKFFDKHRF